MGSQNLPFMRQRVTTIVAELIAALEPSTAARLKSIPLVFDPSTSEVNAFATCSRTRKAAIALTDGILILSASIARLRASDELYGTQLLAEYTHYVAREQRPSQPILPPPPNSLTYEQREAAPVLALQLRLFDEMIAFVFGHELAHHYLNHLPCTSVLPLDASELGIVLTDAVPAFNQPNESAADMAGIRNVLIAGRKRSTSPLTEAGALAQLSFFVALDSARPADVFTFERTHPPPSVRIPIVQATAQAVRATGMVTLPF